MKHRHGPDSNDVVSKLQLKTICKRLKTVEKILTMNSVSCRLSGLSPFLGDNDAETLTNILACRWDLEDEEFQDISEEAKEFISKLLIKEKR